MNTVKSELHTIFADKKDGYPYASIADMGRYIWHTELERALFITSYSIHTINFGVSLFYPQLKG